MGGDVRDGDEVGGDEVGDGGFDFCRFSSKMLNNLSVSSSLSM